MANNKSARLESLDALRGFDMLFIAGLASLIAAICNLFPGGADCWLATQMHHAAWDGFRHHDSIFPLFIFLAGMSFPYSYAKSQEKGLSRAAIYKKMFVRAIVLILLGLVFNGVLRLKPGFRIFSVLERIAVAGLVASILFVNFKTKTRVIIAAAILVVYGAISFIPAPDAPAAAGSFSFEGNLAAYIDRQLFGNHIYKPGVYDPEGLLSTLGAVVTAMLGNFTGEYIRESKHSGNKKVLFMFAAAAVMLAVGLLVSIWIPVNKALWSSSFVLVVGAYSVALFALFYWIIDVRGHRKWAFPLKVVGMNSIAIYLLQRVVNFDYTVNFFLGGVISKLPEAPGKVLFWCGYILLGWLILYLMYRKKIFLKV